MDKLKIEVEKKELAVSGVAEKEAQIAQLKVFITLSSSFDPYQLIFITFQSLGSTKTACC